MKVKFNEVFSDDTKNVERVPLNKYIKNGDIAIVDQGKEKIIGYTNNKDLKICNEERIIFGDHTRIFKYVNIPFITGADGTKVLKIKNTSQFNYKYMYYYLQNSYIPNTGYNRHFKWVKELEFEIPNINIQKEIVNRLDKIQIIIDIRKKQVEELDTLIKSQFVEMFGNSISNDKELNCMEMPSVCEIIDGDRGKNYPKSKEFFENEYCLFLNAKNVTSTGFSFENCMYITKEKDEKLRNGKLQRGDVVLTTRGTVGNLAFYTEDIPFENVRINSGMVILRIRKDIVNEIFFIEQFKMQLENIKNKIANGSAQPQLPIAKMNGIKVLTPNKELQNKFADLVKQIDKQKVKIQKSLEEMQILQESLMNKYFINL